MKIDSAKDDTLVGIVEGGFGRAATGRVPVLFFAGCPHEYQGDARFNLQRTKRTIDPICCIFLGLEKMLFFAVLGHSARIKGLSKSPAGSWKGQSPGFGVRRTPADYKFLFDSP